MKGREYLETARDTVKGWRESDWRTTVGRAYYALYLECRDALLRWGFFIPIHGSHGEVAKRFGFASLRDLNEIGKTLHHLSAHRKQADYEIATIGYFVDDVRALTTIKDATAAIALLDAIDTDPARRTAAIADIRRAFP